MALILYSHPLASYCWKVLIALYENDTPFTQHTVDLGDPAAKAAFAALWPTAKIPLLQDTTRNRVVPETSVAIEYLDQHHPGRTRLLPTEQEACLEARLWDRIFDAYVMTPMQDIVANRLRPENERDPRRVNDAQTMLQMAYDLIDMQVIERQWAAGASFSLADCAAAPALFYASTLVPFGSARTHLAAYFERLLARPSVARTIAEARPYFRFYPFSESIPARFLAIASGT